MPKKSAAKKSAPAAPTCPKGHKMAVEAGMHVCSTCSPRYMAHIQA